jgi:DNA-binding XRE family transcriptional regulator
MKRLYLANLRAEKEMKQEIVAKHLGILQSSYSGIENGQRRIRLPLDLILKFSAIFSKPVEEIISLENDYQDSTKLNIKVD